MNKSIKKWLTRHALTMLAMATTLTASAQDSELIAEQIKKYGEQN